MPKRGPPSKVVAFPIWRSRFVAGQGAVETTEHPDTGTWWVRRSVQQRVVLIREGRREVREVWVWTSWVPAKVQPQIGLANWRMRRQPNMKTGGYVKAMLPIEIAIPA